MATDGEHALSTRRKRRGVVRASVTRLDSRVSELERKKETSPGDLATAQRFLRKLDELDEEFKSHHLSIVDLIGEESIDTEQGILDDHDDKVASLSSRLQQFISKLSSAHSSASMDSNPKQHHTRRLSHLERDLKLVVTTVDTITPGSEVDTCMLQQYEEQLSGLKAELARISSDILMLDEEDAGLSDRESALSKSHFEVCLKIRRLLQSPVKSSSVPTPTVDRSGVKLPKLLSMVMW